MAAGAARSADYTWEAAAAKTWRVLDAVVRKGQPLTIDS
jgi:hypothetical protein